MPDEQRAASLRHHRFLMAKVFDREAALEADPKVKAERMHQAAKLRELAAKGHLKPVA